MLHSTKHINVTQRKFVKLARKTRMIKTAKGNVSISNTREPLPLPYGIYSAQDDVMGNTTVWNFPMIEKQANSLTNGYEESSSEMVAEILRSFSVHPDKDVTALNNHSYLYAPGADGCPFVLVAKDGKEQQLVLSTKEPHFSLLKRALELASSEENPHIQSQISCIMDRKNPLHGVSITKLCIKNQKKIREIIQEQKSLKMLETNLNSILSINGNNPGSAADILEAKKQADHENLISVNQQELQKDSLCSGANTLFNTSEVQKKNNLPDANQISFEKGLRNAAS